MSIADQIAELHADFAPDPDAASAALRFGGYVEPGDPEWDLLFERTVGAADPDITEALEEATAAPRAHLDGLLEQAHAYAGELLTRDLEVAIDALLSAQVGVYRAALAGRGRGEAA